MVSRFLMQSSSFVGVRMSAHTTGFINMFHQYQYHLWVAPLFCLIMPSHMIGLITTLYAKRMQNPVESGKAWYLDLFLANAGLSGYMSGVSGVLIKSGLYH